MLDPVPVEVGSAAVPLADVPARRVWGMLLARAALALSFQALFAVAYLAIGSQEPWRLAADWWLGAIMLTNVVCIALLSKAMTAEGRRMRDLWLPPSDDRGKDIRWFVLALIGTVPLSAAPNLLLGAALWGDPAVGAELSFRPLPLWGLVAILAVFPVTQGLTELPTYFGYAMPRLQARYGKVLWPLLLCGFVLSEQHVFLPLLFDWRFVVWRALMFLPFASWMAFVLYKRPTLMPYVMVVHGLIDLTLPVIVLTNSLPK